MISIQSNNPFRPEGRDHLFSRLRHRAAAPASVLASVCRATWGRRTSLVAVTGSFGKTTTTRAVLAAFGIPEHPYQTAGYNAFTSLYGQLVRQVSRGRPWGVLEIGIGRPGQMRRYARVVRPHIAVVTGIGFAHIEYFPDGRDGLRHEKAHLVRALPADGIAVLNRDDPNVMWMATQTCARSLTYGFDPHADVAVVAHELRWPAGTSVSVRVEGRVRTIQSKLIGRGGVYAILSALAAAHAAGLDLDEASAALETVAPTPHRLQPIELSGGVFALLDDSKGTLSTVLLAIDTLEQVPAQRRLAVLGHLPRRAPLPREAFYEQMGRHAGRVLDRAYRSALIEAGMDPSHIVRVASVHEAADRLRQDLRPGDVLLLKAHNHDRLARIVMLLQGAEVRCRARVCPRDPLVPCSRCRYLKRDFDPPLGANEQSIHAASP